MLRVDRDETSDDGDNDDAAAAACGSDDDDDDDDETRAEDATRTRMSLISETIMP
jgi:hypothetical protein